MKTLRIGLLAIALTLLMGAPALAQTGHDLLQQALVMEQAEGNLQEAIQLYERIVQDFGNDRALAARALVQMGKCHEKMGSQGARDAYARVIQEFGDQTDQVAVARERLADLQGQDRTEPKEVPSAQVRRLLLKDDGGCYVFGMRPSPDGTRLAYSDYCGTLAIFVRDLESGETHRVTSEGVYLGVVWSPDGTRLATGDVGAERSPLKLIDLASGAVETPAALEGLWFLPRDWSPDGEHLTGTLHNKEDQIVSSVVVSLRTGDVITLASPVKQGGDDSAFSPNGRYVAFTDYAEGNQDVYVTELGTGERYRVTSDPGAEGGALWSPDGNTIVYKNDDGMWAIRMANGRPQGQPRSVRRGAFMPSAWTANGYYYAVSNSVGQAFRIPLDPRTAETIGPPEVLPDVNGLLWFAWSPDMRQIASSGWDDQEHIHVTRGRSVTAFPIGDEIMTSNLWWSGDGREILFTTAARATRDGRTTVFALDPSNGAVRELLPKQDSIHHIHVSPDDAKMVFLRSTESRLAGELVVSDLGDPDGLVLASASDLEGRLSTMFGQPRFSPDGSQILFLRQKRTEAGEGTDELWVVTSDGSEPPRLLATAPIIRRVIWDPSGRFIAVQALDASGETTPLSVVSLDTGAKHEVLPQSALGKDLWLNDWSPDGRWIGISQSTGPWEYWVAKDPLGENRRRP